ncbi:MAG: hypothetical protein Q7R52_02475 [archaeon]|nr:hypothetical protein [archaeon]
MPDKPRKIEFSVTENGYMKFCHLSEFPTLNDIKYIIEKTMEHFKNTNNSNRLFEMKNFLQAVVNKYSDKNQKTLVIK